MPKIVRFHETGGAEVLRLEEAPLAQPGAGEVRLAVEAIGLNRAEVMYRMGRYLEDPKLPSRIGYEAAGIVDAVGPGVTGVEVGDRVSTIPSFSMTTHGVYGESAIVPAYSVARYPERLSAVEGAAIWMQYLTAYGALMEFGKIGRGMNVLITAASSSVGLAAIQIARSVGAVPIATTRGAAKKEFLRDAGAERVIVTDEEDLVEAVLEATARVGAQVIFDPVAGPGLEKLADCAALQGIIFEYGALSQQPTPFPLFAAIGRGLTVRGYILFEIVRSPEMLARGKEFIVNGLEKGTLRPIIDRTFPLSDIVEAHRYMESNVQRGKIVVTV